MVAMAELRLLLVSGNLGLASHGPRADRAHLECPAGVPWCDLARADYEILSSQLGLPADLNEAARLINRAQEDLPGPAMARRVWMGEAEPQQLDGLARDGLGDGLLEHATWPTGPGTWFVGLGFSGAPGAGVGGGVRFVHPDVRWSSWRLQSDASLTTRGSGQLSMQLSTPGTLWSVWALRGGRLILDNYQTGETISLNTINALAGPGLRRGRAAVWAGPLLRLDQVDGERLSGHGLALGATHTANVLRLSARMEQTLIADYRHTRLSTTAITTLPVGNTTTLVRLHGSAAPESQAPWWHLPSAGGGEHLRSAPLGRWRGLALAAAAVELRSPIIGALGGVVFAEVAAIEGVHPGGGAGLRLYLPPQPHSTLRIDLGYGEDGAVLTAGWGEAF